MLEGFDIAGIAGPLVTTAFTLAGNAKVSVTIAVGAKAKLNAGKDVMVVSGGVPVTVSAVFYKQSNRETPDVNARVSTLIIDPTELANACAAADGGAGVPIPPLANNDKIVITDNTGNREWTIFEQNPIPAGLLLSYQVRR